MNFRPFSTRVYSGPYVIFSPVFYTGTKFVPRNLSSEINTQEGNKKYIFHDLSSIIFPFLLTRFQFCFLITLHMIVIKFLTKFENKRLSFGRVTLFSDS